MISEILKGVQQYFWNLKCKMVADLCSQKKCNKEKQLRCSKIILHKKDHLIFREGQCICPRKEAHSKMHFDLGRGQDNS